MTSEPDAWAVADWPIADEIYEAVADDLFILNSQLPDLGTTAGPAAVHMTEPNTWAVADWPTADEVYEAVADHLVALNCQPCLPDSSGLSPALEGP